MQSYPELIDRLMKEGAEHGEEICDLRALTLFGEQLHFDLSGGLPIVTLSKDEIRTQIAEVLWFVKDIKDGAYLQRYNVKGLDHLWQNDDTSAENMWRRWPGLDGRGTDQLKNLVSQIRHNPSSRRMMLSLWEPSTVNYMDRPPCNIMLQFLVMQGKLHCQFYQRTSNVLNRLPKSVFRFGSLTCMLAHHCGLKPGTLVWTAGDVHLYSHDLPRAEKLLAAYKEGSLRYPELKVIGGHEKISEYEVEDVEIGDFTHMRP